MLTRIVAARRLPKAFGSVRLYSSEQGFNRKEQAHENQFARKLEQEQLKKLKKQIEDKKSELAELEKKHEEVEQKK